MGLGRGSRWAARLHDLLLYSRRAEANNQTDSVATRILAFAHASQRDLFELPNVHRNRGFRPVGNDTVCPISRSDLQLASPASHLRQCAQSHSRRIAGF